MNISHSFFQPNLFCSSRFLYGYLNGKIVTAVREGIATADAEILAEDAKTGSSDLVQEESAIANKAKSKIIAALRAMNQTDAEEEEKK